LHLRRTRGNAQLCVNPRFQWFGDATAINHHHR
jgi:hypothetical protein